MYSCLRLRRMTEEILLSLVLGRDVKLSVWRFCATILWVHSSFNSYIGKEFNFPSFICSFMTMLPRKDKNIITECSNTLTKKYRLVAYRRTVCLNCEGIFVVNNVFHSIISEAFFTAASQ